MRKTPANREPRGHGASPATENSVAERSDRSERRRGGKDSPTKFSAVPGFAHERPGSDGRTRLVCNRLLPGDHVSISRIPVRT
jgi:hypothetical protein